MEYALSVNLNGGGGISPSSVRRTRRGPSTPMCSHTDDEPGPPLNENVIGRLALSFTPSLIYATKNICARGLSISASLSLSHISSLRTIVPVVTVYLIVLPLILTECLVSTKLSLGIGFSSFFSSFFSSGF